MRTLNTMSSSCELQGRLFLHEQIRQALKFQNVRQKEADYDLPPGRRLKDEVSRAFQIAMGAWQDLEKVLGQNRTEAECQKATLLFAQQFFWKCLDYPFQAASERVTAKGESFAVQSWVNGLPLIVVSAKKGLDEAAEALSVLHTGGETKKSAFQAAQELLNASDTLAWGFAFNGLTVRLLRKSVSISRPSYLEFHLSDILTAGSFPEFFELWAVLHASRTKVEEGKNVWERWIEEGVETGARARENLAGRVTHALRILGEGFLKEPSNQALREALSSGALTSEAYGHELLRLMYRFLFVFCLEERGLMHPENALPEAVGRYQAGYALRRFREPCLKNRFLNDYTDAWASVKIVFRALSRGEPRLALPALGGLFDASSCPAIDASALSNRDLMLAMRELRWGTAEGGVTAPIDYRHLGTEELGSVYESLLELIPVVDAAARTFAYADFGNADNERKSTGSYYTPDALVQSLIHTALDPVIEQAVKAHPKDPGEALLKLRVIDPACGSGHFLLAAARRIAEKLAEERSLEGSVTAEDYRSALRDVIEHDIYGVDVNPMTVELARMSLWLEGFSRGKPLSFLDHHLKTGNSVLGIGNLEELQKGIPSAAFKAQAGDDREVVKRLSALNRKGLRHLNAADFNKDTLPFADPLQVEEINRIEAMPTETLEETQKKSEAWRTLEQNLREGKIERQCDLFVTAFLSPKTRETEALVPTTQELCHAIEILGDPDPEYAAYARGFCREHRVFHWPIEFAGVFDDGGFDCVLGNPPWEVAKIEDKKWFAARHPSVANAKNQSVRKKMIAALGRGRLHVEFEGSPLSPTVEMHEKNLFHRYLAEQNLSKAESNFYREGPRFRYTGTGESNLFALIAELMVSVRKASGTAGMVVPPGLLTNDTWKAFARRALSGKISSFYHFDNTRQLFPEVDSRFSFALITFRESSEMDCVFYANDAAQLEDKNRHIVFEEGDFLRLNPNTGTLFLPRTREDLGLCRKIYDGAGGILIEEGKDDGNPWALQTMRMFDMSNDSRLFFGEDAPGRVPLFEGKMIHQFDNRFATYRGKTNVKGEPVTEYPTEEEKKDFGFRARPRYWGSEKAVEAAFEKKKVRWKKPWMLAFRDIARTTDQRTVMCAVLPSNWGAGNNAPLLLPDVENELAACLLANLNSLIVDFVDRIKQPGTHVSIYILNQLPVLAPQAYSEADRSFIAPRVARLTKNDKATAACWLPQYPSDTWQDPEVRLTIRAELDAYFARLYGLNRRDLEYILDPRDVCGGNHPSVTFPGLRTDEEKLYGEYLTKRLVLEAFDRLARAEENA